MYNYDTRGATMKLEDLAELLALDCAPDLKAPISTPKSYKEAIEGYTFILPQRTINKAKSDSFGHRIGSWDTLSKWNTSRGSIDLYSTEEKAMLALKQALVLELLETLKKLDEKGKR